MTASITSTIPVLASLNVQESVDFYTGCLGFSKLNQFDDYAILARDGCEIHFWACKDRYIVEHTSCYIRTKDTDALYKEFAKRGLEIAGPVAQPWGMKELYVIDPHGNLLKFGETI